MNKKEENLLYMRNLFKRIALSMSLVIGLTACVENQNESNNSENNSQIDEEKTSSDKTFTVNFYFDD